MKLIKLDAIDSTNEFLKGLSSTQTVENFTVVTAETQTKGKGQMGAVWVSESGKNLIMSILVKDFLFDNNAIFDINIATAVSVIQALELYNIPELRIKWPNDIMSYNKKIGGILIENSLKSEGTIVSIVGLGLNVNQMDFEHLPKASSLAAICKTTFDKEDLLFKIVQKFEENVQSWKQNKDLLWACYSNLLFKKGTPMPFADANQQNFMGIIQGVTSIGKLQILLEDDSVSEFGIKEIQMLY
ncbi:BirA family transcriptional regulator, biotin operon repressor / biotin-[acetyl-CoA-carboxylase] ligase [Flavobacterium fluvii]|uniref:BirA family transcriptional regulator, biotin operon repressor / biotin-[acetyl-CoA-carboxylase] ligase n=1 Tax=Flavobacterium fluvii TaxID=468056 RepID=A0A1M5P6C3_9FLAO|nr:biotin--[acetyl-CoA-carboxylase] ligase [Flavobacterium fluvii]SHG96763.1 BirA family transcriptional regulator, biotin operon repressor / biotin-[acetyl-CoA-carboxylase] ligase [Flavobacterium fluvii]